MATILSVSGKSFDLEDRKSPGINFKVGEQCLPSPASPIPIFITRIDSQFHRHFYIASVFNVLTCMRLLVMSPHSENFDQFLIFKYFINQSMLFIDATTD